MQDSRNMILAIVLSVAVLFGWQYFVAGPKMEQAAKQAEMQAAQTAAANPQATAGAGAGLPTPSADGTVAQPQPSAGTAPIYANRADAVAAQPRVKIDTPSLTGSINLVGARLDDVELKNYHETVDDSSPIITLLNPLGATDPYFVEQGWIAAAGGNVAVPDARSVWSVEGNPTLTPSTPVTLNFDNGAGIIFRQTFAVDADYLFTVTQSVENTGTSEASLYPYSRVARHDTPNVKNFFVLHEGPIGVLGDANLIEKTYKDLKKEGQIDVQSNGGWLGITDKYWAAAILPEPGTPISARFSWTQPAAKDVYQTSFVDQDVLVTAPGATNSVKTYVFAGAKVESIINSYEQQYGFDRVELLIDWGWFHFLTKPMFYVIRWLHGHLGNFGLAILAVTVGVKAIFFPLASRSYKSMAAMRKVQPQMKDLQERFKDDRAGQQQAMMELYKKEKINPVSGCWPMLIQIPVFFSLYKVLFVTIEMRHAPFFGWIQDLAAQDPTNVFTLFGLIPWDPTVVPLIGGFLTLGVWPLIMGITMWVQMKLNPPPTDPSQAMIFNLMPIMFTFMLGTFPAGLVIYWAWNNFLSVTQQWIIMKRNGVEVDLLGNILGGLGLRKDAKK